MAASEKILLLDSGLGGLTVFREVAALRPHADYIYVADDAAFPYGRLDEQVLVARVVDLMSELIEAHRPDLVVIPCNTASTIALPALRQKFSVPFVGTVLGTEATVSREYTRALIRDYAEDCRVKLVGSRHLAAYAEAELAGVPASDAQIQAEIAPCFDDDGARTDTIVLACTHYPLLIDRLTKLAPWNVSFINPAPAIARRVVDLLGPATTTQTRTARAIFTSGRAPEAALARFGIRAGAPATTGSDLPAV
jgi:glutamate racemase